MRLLKRLRGRLWRSVYAALGSPASGGPAAIGSHPASSESQKRIHALPKAAPRGGLCFCDASVVMGEKLAPMLRYFACGDKLVTLMCIVNQFGARMKRVSPVGSCRMTLRVLFAGALAALPLLVTGALAQTAATPPAATTSAAPSANPASPRRRPDLRRRADPGKSVCADPGEPAGRDGHLNAADHSGKSPGIGPPEPVHASGGDAAGGGSRFGAQRFPVDGCARSRPGRRAAAEAEESRAAARDRAQRRSSPNPSARHLLRHRQGVRALFGDRGRGRLADRHRRDRARNEGPGGCKVTQAPGDRRRPVGRRGERARLGQRAHGRGQALPGAHGTPPDRHRLRRDAESDQRSGEGALQPACLERQSPRRAQFLLR